MSGMHLLPMYFTTTKSSRRGKKQKVPAKLQAARDQHEKYLNKMVSGKYKDSYIQKRALEFRPLPESNFIPTSDTVGNGYRKNPNAYTGEANMIIGQAYNKSGLQVLSSKDAADPSTGKRR
jgi:hypothetical protein